MFVILLVSIAISQSQNTENTLKLDDPDLRPEAKIDSIAWLAGVWKGKAFGGEFEEIWTIPSGGAMAGLFKLMHEGKPTMYEFEIIVEEMGSLIIKLKHFNSDLIGWEDKDKFISFPLVKLTNDAAYFDGLTYRKIGSDKLQVFVAIKRDGKIHEEELLCERVKEELK
jgi:hypothetical protein